MKKIHYLIPLVVLLLISLLYAQDKVTPPPTRMTLPEDTTRVKKETKGKLDAQKPQLELPDVLIFGQDKSIRMSGKKENLRPESPTLIQPTSPYEPISIWFRQQSQKPGLEQQRGQVDKLNWLMLQAGGYTSILADAGHWQRLQKGHYRLRGWLDRSNGQYNNSNYAQAGLSGKLNYEMAPRVTGTVRANFAHHSRGLHGAVINDFTRRTSTGSFGADLLYDIAKLSDGHIGFEIGGTSLQSDTNSVRYDKTSDFWYQLEFGYTAQWRGIQWSTMGNYKRETFETLQDSTNLKTSLGDISLEALTPLSSSLTALFGLSYQNTTVDTVSIHSRVSPYFKLNFMPNNRIGLTGEIYTGYQLKTFTQWWHENPYLSHRIPLAPEETNFSLNLKTEIELTRGLRLFAAFARQWLKTAYYWQLDPQLNLINLIQIDKPELTQSQFGVVVDLGHRTRLQAFFINYSDRIDVQDNLPEIGRIPYRPDYRIPVRATVQLLSDMFLTLQADIYGPRKKNLLSDDRLPAFALMHARLEKGIGEKFSLVVNVRNLLDANYVIWENYPEMGVHVLMGLRAKF